MRALRIGAALLIMLVCASLRADTPAQKLTITGKLIRVMAIGGESTGWAIETDSDVTIDGKHLHSIEIAYRRTDRLAKLENKRVTAKGQVTHRAGVETGDRIVLTVYSLRETPLASGASESTAAGTPPFNPPFQLIGTEWQLEDLAGAGVLDNVQATLTFPEAEKVAGNGSCNRFFGPAKIAAQAITLGPLGSSRMACPEAVMGQETKYLNALQAAERLQWKDPYLLIYCKGLEKPLHFTRITAVAPATP